MQTSRARFKSWKDLAYFLRLSALISLGGGLLLVLLEFKAIPADSIVGGFFKSYSAWVVSAAWAMVAIPPIFARGLSELREREQVVNSRTDTGRVLTVLSSRSSNLVLKVREGFAGQESNTYQNYLIAELKSYFTAKFQASTKPEDGDLNFEVSYYAANIRPKSKLLERKLYTHANSTQMRSNFSNRNDEGAACIAEIFEGRNVYCADVRDPATARRLQITDGATRKYRSFLSVPVFRDRKTADESRILGMLSISATHVGGLDEDDAALLEVFAWLLAAAFEIDRGASARAAAPRTTVGDAD